MLEAIPVTSGVAGPVVVVLAGPVVFVEGGPDVKLWLWSPSIEMECVCHIAAALAPLSPCPCVKFPPVTPPWL